MSIKTSEHSPLLKPFFAHPLLAGEPDRFMPVQTGLMWILTPVKSPELAWGHYPYPKHLSWPYIVTPTGAILDWRVVLIDVAVIAFLTVAVPRYWISRRSAAASLVSATTGLAFGLTIVAVSFSADGRASVRAAYLVGTLVTYVVSLGMILRASRRRHARSLE
jgi:hypothetical protein